MKQMVSVSCATVTMKATSSSHYRKRDVFIIQSLLQNRAKVVAIHNGRVEYYEVCDVSADGEFLWTLVHAEPGHLENAISKLTRP